VRLLVDRLDARDTVSMVVYAGAAGLVLPPTRGNDHAAILAALDRLEAGGSTNGGAGIELAYATARANLVEGGVNRIVLCTDGDFNVGTTDRGSLTRYVEEQARSGVALSILGFGMGNYKDARLEELTNKGDGNYAYIDTLNEARKVLVEQLMGTLVTLAKDAKVQVFFNPRAVASWRLIGYENRLLKKDDFNDDKKDAGDVGAGHSVTALYEIVPAGAEAAPRKADENPFLERAPPAAEAAGGALLRLRLRYKPPGAEASVLLEQDVREAAASRAPARTCAGRRRRRSSACCCAATSTSPGRPTRSARRSPAAPWARTETAIARRCSTSPRARGPSRPPRPTAGRVEALSDSRTAPPERDGSRGRPGTSEVLQSACGSRGSRPAATRACEHRTIARPLVSRYRPSQNGAASARAPSSISGPPRRASWSAASTAASPRAGSRRSNQARAISSSARKRS